MDAELKAKWIAALRSGEFKQARNKLRRTDSEGGASYCCLGVLCVVANIPIDQEGVFCEGYPVTVGKGNGYEPIRRVLDKDYAALTEMNDDGGASFAEIADYIEKNY